MMEIALYKNNFLMYRYRKKDFFTIAQTSNICIAYTSHSVSLLGQFHQTKSQSTTSISSY